MDNAIWLDQVIPAEPFMAEHFLSTLAKMHRLTARLSAELQVLLGGGPTQPTGE